MTTAAKSKTEQAQVDHVTDWLVSANDEFFGEKGRIDGAELKKALVGFVVFAIGVGIILSQVL